MADHLEKFPPQIGLLSNRNDLLDLFVVKNSRIITKSLHDIEQMRRKQNGSACFTVLTHFLIKDLYRFHIQTDERLIQNKQGARSNKPVINTTFCLFPKDSSEILLLMYFEK